MRTSRSRRQLSGYSGCLKHTFIGNVKKKTIDACERLDGTACIEEHTVPYRVDGEVGRFTFATHHLIDAEGNEPFHSRDLFPEQRGKWYYATQGLKEIGLFSGAVDQSYRRTKYRLNRQRRQETDGTPLSTLRDLAEREGDEVVDFWTQQSGDILDRHGVSPEAEGFEKTPMADPEAYRSAEVESTIVQQATEEAAIPDTFIEEAKSNPVPYQLADQTVEIYIDGVSTKKQKPHRRVESSKEESKRVNNRIAVIRHRGQGYCMAARSYAELLRFVVAFLIHNSLWSLQLCFYVDGEKTIKNTIAKWFSWHPKVRLIMDWYHLRHKCEELCSLALKGRKIRNGHLDKLRPMLWYGCVNSAITYLESIPDDHVKNPKSMESLMTYLGNHSKHIPCYAIRKQLALCNSSTRVEKANDHLVSIRQKHNGMSWSEDGSLGLAALSAVRVNRSQDQWLDTKTMPFMLLSDAA